MKGQRVTAPHLLVTLAAAAFCAALPLARPAQAAPPPEGSEDSRIMAPHSAWIRSQHDKRGAWCCDIGDGRPVDARIAGDHWEAHVTPAHFPEETDRWVAVPMQKVLGGGNPTGSAILWLLRGQVQCFAPPDGV